MDVRFLWSYGFAVLVYFMLGFIKEQEHEFRFSILILGALISEILFPILLFIQIRATISSLSHFIIFTLVLATLSFAVHALGIPGLPQLFPPFTIRTEIELWVCFSGLAVTTFHNKQPEVVRYAILPVLVAGAILCVAFVISLFPTMLFAWLFFWLGGLGLLVYSPVFSLIAFMRSLREIRNSLPEKRISTWLIRGTLAIILSYSILYKIQWDRTQTLVYEEGFRLQKLNEQEISTGRGPISPDDARYAQYQRNVETNVEMIRSIRNGKKQCERLKILPEVCPFVNSLLSVEECTLHNGCQDDMFRLAD